MPLPKTDENLAPRLLEISERVQAIQDAADDAERQLTEAELREVSGLHREFEQLEARQRAADIANAVATPRGRVTDPARPGTSEPIATGGRSVVDALIRPDLQGRRFGDLFGAVTAPQRVEFNSLAEMVRVAFKNPLDRRLQVMNAPAGMSEGTGADGGFLVPPQFSAALIDRSLEMEVVRPRANVVPATSNVLMMPFWQTDQTSGKRAGLTLAWLAEGQSNSAQKAKLSIGNIPINKGGILVPITDELLEDSAASISAMNSALVNATAAGLDIAFMFGAGTGQPVGVMNSPCLVTVSKEGSQTAATIVEANILKMAARLAPSSWGRAVWFVHPTTLPQLLTLAQATGPNDGGRTVILTERDGSLFLLTRPVIVTDACAPLGTTGDIILGDWSKYVVALRHDIRIQTSIHLYFGSGETAVRLLIRVGGQPEIDAPIKLRDGTNTVSPFVALETRS
jgi:HK97 family phage major capsid protein